MLRLSPSRRAVYAPLVALTLVFSCGEERILVGGQAGLGDEPPRRDAAPPSAPADAKFDASPRDAGPLSSDAAGQSEPDSRDASVPVTIACGTTVRPLRGQPLRGKPEEIADRLSRFLYGAAPTTALLESVTASMTTTELGRLTVDRLRELEPAAIDEGGTVGRGAQLVRSLRAWLGLRDGAIANAARESLIRAFATERDRFLLASLFEGDLPALLGARFTFVDRELAAHYELPPPALEGFAKVELPEGGRGGVLTQAAWLANFPSPSPRGAFIQSQFLCRTVSPDPPMRPATPRPPSRPSLEALTADGECQVCHELIDPPGFAFAQWDELGRQRDSDDGRPINTAGWLELDGRVVRFANSGDLSQALAGSCAVQACLTRTLLEQLIGRRLSTEEEPAAAAVLGAFLAADLRLEDLVVAAVAISATLVP